MQARRTSLEAFAMSLKAGGGTLRMTFSTFANSAMLGSGWMELSGRVDWGDGVTRGCWAVKKLCSNRENTAGAGRCSGSFG